MKPARPLFIALGITALMVALLAGLVLTPAVQRMVLLRVLAAKLPGLKLDLRSFSAGPGSAVIENARIEYGQTTFTLGRVEADYSLTALLFGRRLQLDRIAARDVVIDASRLPRNRITLGAATAPGATPGTLAHLKLPIAIFIGDLDITATALLPGSTGHPPIQTELRITGGQLAPGREGTIMLKSRLADLSPTAIVSTLDVQARLQLTQSFQHSFDRIKLATLVDAQGPGFPGQHQLKMTAELSRAATGEDYQLRVDTVRDGRSEEIVSLQGTLPVGETDFKGDWKLAARTPQLAPFLIGGALPEFEATGGGQFVYTLGSHRLNLRGRIQSTLDGLETVQPALRALGALRLDTEFDLLAANREITFNQCNGSIANEHEVIGFRATRPIFYDLKKQRIGLVGDEVGEMARLKLTNLPLDWIRPFVTAVDISGGGCSGEMILEAAGTDKLGLRSAEPATIDSLTVVRAGHTLTKNARVQFDVLAGYSAGQAQFQFRDIVLKTAAGDTITGAVTFSGVPTSFQPLRVVGNFNAELPKLVSHWAPVGTIHAKGSADFIWKTGKIEVEQLTFDSADDKGRLVAGVELARPFGFDLAKLRAELDQAGEETALASLKFGTLPLSALARRLPGVKLGGWTNPGEVGLYARGPMLVVRAKSPLRVSELSMTLHQKIVLEKLTLECSPVVELTGGEFSRAAAEGVALHDSSGAALATLTAEMTAGSDGKQHSSLNFDLDLPSLSGQPLLGRADSLSAGRASGEIRSLADAAGAQVEARATLNGLVDRESGQVLPVANLNLRAALRADGRVSIEAPILLDHAGERSDLGISAEGTRDASGLSLEAKLVSAHVELSDVLTLCAIASLPLGLDATDGTGAQNRALSPPAADEKPFWDGLQGHLSLDAKSVTEGKDWPMSGVTGRIALKPDRLQLEKLESGLGDQGKLTAQGTLEFAAGLNPYHLTGGFAVTDFDSARFFKSAEPDRVPSFEGIFNVKANLEGRGLTLGDTLDRTRGEFDLTSRQGVFRGFRRPTDKLSMATKAVELGAAVDSLLGTTRVRPVAEKVAGIAYYVDQMAQSLAELPYDQLSLKVAREESLDLRLDDVVLVSPEVRLLGHGKIAYVAGKPLLQQPLTAAFTLACRGKTEEVFDKLHAMEGSRDDFGYAKVGEPFTLTGSLSRPDPTDFFLRLASARQAEQPAAATGVEKN